jgi:glycosyltransferase involved in cell wall biosynthesis
MGEDEARWVCPIKLFEYMAAGKPIVCSDWDVARQVLDDGRNGLLRAADDPAAWEEALVYLRDHVSTRERLGRQAQQDFEVKHPWKKRAERVLESLPLA